MVLPRLTVSALDEAAEECIDARLGVLQIVGEIVDDDPARPRPEA